MTMDKYEDMTPAMPQWNLGGGRIDEVDFCQDYLARNCLVSWNGNFYTTEGRMTDINILRRDIYREITPFVNSGIARKVDSIVDVMRIEAARESLPMHERLIHVANGTYDLVKGYTPEKMICRHRLPVRYNPDAPRPEKWEAFLNDLLEPEDILTLQEYMGYCLLPVNYGQKMLMIIGQGGEGKSRIGLVMYGLLGANMKTGSISKVEHNKFARADLESILVMVDDDMKLEALRQTNNLKTIITAELPMDLERKGVQSHQGDLRVRFLAFGNGSIQAENDASYGFFRRQIILTAKPRPENRVDDPYLGKRLLQELEGIFLWCLEGLVRILGQNYQFTQSEKARENLAQSMTEGDNTALFLASEGYIERYPEGMITSRELYSVYRRWCADNTRYPLCCQRFWGQIRQRLEEEGIHYSDKIPLGPSRYVRGFKGLIAV